MKLQGASFPKLVVKHCFLVGFTNLRTVFLSLILIFRPTISQEAEDTCGVSQACQDQKGVCLHPAFQNIPEEMEKRGICSQKRGCFCYTTAAQKQDDKYLYYYHYDDASHANMLLPPVIVGDKHHHINNWEDFRAVFNPKIDSPEDLANSSWSFEDRLEKIKANNRVNKTKLAINKFDHLTFNEFLARNTGARFPKKPKAVTSQEPESDAVIKREVPEAFEWWDTVGAITEVKDQDPCGVCWAFGAQVSLEACKFLNTWQSANLSVQQIIDCSYPERMKKDILGVNFIKEYFLFQP